MNRIAYCVLTHNHSDYIEDLLRSSYGILDKYEMDIIICDDSDDDKTKRITELIVSEGATNIFYADAHIAQNGDDKLFRILKKEFFSDKYEYIWPVKDRVIISEAIIKTVRERCDTGVDIVTIANEIARTSCVLPMIKDEYDSIVYFAEHYGSYTTNWQSVVFNNNTMLTGVNWEVLSSEYGLGPACPFNQPVFTLTRLSQLSSPRIGVIRLLADEIKIKGGSNWTGSTVELWIDKWVKAVMSLPSVYDSVKPQLLKSETNGFELFGSGNTFIRLSTIGAISEEQFSQYESYWNLISDIPADIVKMLIRGQFADGFYRILTIIDDAFATGDFEKAYFFFTGNSWMKDGYVDDEYSALAHFFARYRYNMFFDGYSNIINDVKSFNDAVEKGKAIMLSN